MMQYEVYNTSNSSRGDTLPLRHRSSGGGGGGRGFFGATEGSNRQQQEQHDGAAVGGCRWCESGRLVVLLLVAFALGWFFVVHSVSQLSEANAQIEAALGQRIANLANEHTGRLSKLERRLADSESAARDLERQMIEVSRLGAENGKAIASFTNMSKTWTLPEFFNGGRLPTPVAAANGLGTAGAAVAAGAGAATGDTTLPMLVDARLKQLEAQVAAVLQRTAGAEAESAAVAELRQTVAGLKLTLELKITEQLEAVEVALGEAKERFVGAGVRLRRLRRRCRRHRRCRSCCRRHKS